MLELEDICGGERLIAPRKVAEDAGGCPLYLNNGGLPGTFSRGGP